MLIQKIFKMEITTSCAMKFVDEDDGEFCLKCQSRKERIFENGLVVCRNCRHLKAVKLPIPL